MTMKAWSMRKLILLVLLVGVLTCGGLAAAQDKKIPPFWEEHGSPQIDRLKTRALIEEICDERPGSCEEIRYGGPGEVNVLADSATHLAIRKAIGALEPVNKTVTFKVSLLEASIEPLPAESEGVTKENRATESELRAISDLKKLVPYQDFALLDATTLTTLESAQGLLRASGKHDLIYKALLRIRPARAKEASLTADFQLSVASSMAYGLERGSSVLVNSFSITPGETVVVGSSKIHDKSAIVVLVTYLE